MTVPIGPNATVPIVAPAFAPAIAPTLSCFYFGRFCLLFYPIISTTFMQTKTEDYSSVFLFILF